MASSAPDESTPLLRSENDGEAPAEARRQPSHVTAQEHPGPIFFDWAILRAFQLVLVAGCLSIPFNIASFVMAAIGSAKYDHYDYWNYEQGSFAFLIIISLFLALVNVTWLRRVDHGFKTIVNILVGGWLGVVVAAYMGNNMMQKVTNTSPACDNDRWSPDKVERCKTWVHNYDIVDWIYLVLSCITGVSLALAAIGVLVRACIVLSRRNANNGSSRWTLTVPTLQLSLSVDFRLGSHEDRREQPNA